MTKRQTRKPANVRRMMPKAKAARNQKSKLQIVHVSNILTFLALFILGIY